MTQIYSVPIPRNFTDVDDRFTSIFLGAPDFKLLNSIGCSYLITLDMMMDSLRQGITNVAKRTKRPAAILLFQQCLSEVDLVHEMYRHGKIEEARLKIQEVQQLFLRAGKKMREPVNKIEGC